MNGMLQQNDASKLMEKLPEIYDEPFADNSIVPTLLVSQLAREHVKVALSADGGDEIFAGYNKFNQSIRYTTKYPRPVQKYLSAGMQCFNPKHIPILNKRYNFSTRYEKMQLIWSSGDPISAMKYISQYVTEKEAAVLFRQTTQNYRTNFENGPKLNNNNDNLNRLLAIDYQTFLTDNNLVKVDRATMSVSLEGREPMLDHRLIELLSSIPSDLKIKNGVNKYLLKKIVHKYIPKELMERPKKPFIAPLGIWFKNELKNQMVEYLNTDTLSRQGIFNAKNVVGLRDQYLSGQKVSYQKLWNLLVFQLWYNRWMK